MAFFEDYFHTETILMEVRVYKIQSGKKRIILTQKKKTQSGKPHRRMDAGDRLNLTITSDLLSNIDHIIVKIYISEK